MVVNLEKLDQLVLFPPSGEDSSDEIFENGDVEEVPVDEEDEDVSAISSCNISANTFC